MCLLSIDVTFAQDQDEKDQALVQMTESLFLRSTRAMRTTTHIPFQNWVSTQEAFWLLRSLIDKPGISVALQQDARRVQGLGYYTIGLYDIPADVQSKLAIEIIDDRRNIVLTELAQTYETMGQFRESAIVSEQILALTFPATDMDLNNLARRHLKAGRYSACIATIKRIPLNKEGTEATRLLSARAYAYRGDFEDALRELRKAGDNQEAVNMERVLAHLQTPRDFWRDDKQRRRTFWMPSNRVPTSHAVNASEFQRSIFAISHWFGANYPLYPDVDNSVYPPNMPEDLRPGLYGFASIGAVPFLVFQIKEIDEATQSRLRTILKEIRPQLFGGAAMQPLKLDHKILYRPTDDGYISVLVHQPWQSLVVKLAYPDQVWETL
jgi:tetratricopeptide (TPR) repeat protein